MFELLAMTTPIYQLIDHLEFELLAMTTPIYQLIDHLEFELLAMTNPSSRSLTTQCLNC